GATPHLTAMMFQGMTETQMVHVPYRGETLVLNDMIGGHVDVFFGNIAAAGPPFRDGRVKILALADTHRSPALPEIPTTAEAGLPGLVSAGWFALAAPPKTAPALASEIAKAAVDVIKTPEVQAKFRAASVDPIGNGPARDGGLHQGGSATLERSDQKEQYRRGLRRHEAKPDPRGSRRRGNVTNERTPSDQDISVS